MQKANLALADSLFLGAPVRIYPKESEMTKNNYYRSFRMILRILKQILAIILMIIRLIKELH